jgi:dTDP-4-amino-4,6-dideoxygalactose transaminase
MNAFAVVAEFERRVAEYAGSKYAVAVDCCTSAIFLSLKYIQGNTIHSGAKVSVPARTYVSVPMAVIHSGFSVQFEDIQWKGTYQLNPHPVIDGAKRFTKGMYQGGLHCLSFHTKKILNIGRGGMVLTDDEKAMKWLKKARYDGREEAPYGSDITMMGYHVYMMPDHAARGLMLLDALPDHNEDLTEDYPDLRQMTVFK